jgi:TonB family protein
MTLWLSNLVAYSVQFAVLVFTAAMVTWLLRFRQPRAALAFWQALLVVGLLLPAIQPWTGTGPDFIISTLSLTTAATAAPAATGQGVSVATLLAIVLGTGVVLRLAWLGLGLFRLRQITAKAERPGEISALFAELTTRLGTKADLRITDDVESPATVGARHPVVLLPKRVRDLSAAVQRAVLCHELIHVRRRDWLSTLSEEFVCAVLWFHPAARVLASRICLARETLVDQETIALTGDRRAYAEALLAFSNPRPRLVAATPFVRRRHLAQRIALITKEVSMSPRLVVSITAVACTVVLFATGATVARFPIATTLAAPTRKVFRPGDGITLPRVIKEVKPVYTPAAMQAKIQGSVWLLIVVRETGDVGDLEVTRSLDKEYGLDDQAIKAAREWKFEPGKKGGKAVPVQVTLELTFTLK